jgi:tyrosyl-tRNA synthetase
MSIGDDLITTYARLAAFRSQADCDALTASLAAGRVNPMDAKKGVAQDVVARYHGVDAASNARERFEATVQRKEIPREGVPEIDAGDCGRLSEILVKAGFAQSRREAERLIAGGGVKLDGAELQDPKAAWTATEPVVLSVGSRRFARVVPRKA